MFELEPPDENESLLHLDNVVLSPHALSWTDECERLIGQANTAAVLAVMHGHVLQGLVNRAVLAQQVWRDKLAACRARFGSGEITAK